MGDHFLSIPALKALKKQNLPLVFCCRGGLGPLFKKLGLVDDFVDVSHVGGGDKPNKKKKWGQAIHQLQQYEFENIISEHVSLRTAWNLRKLKAKSRVGYYRWWNFWAFHTRVIERLDFPDALRQLSLLSGLDKTLASCLDSESFQFLNTDSQETINYINDGQIPNWASLSVADRVKTWDSPVEEKYIFLAPGSAQKLKRWHWKNFAQVAKSLIEQGELVALVGSPDESDLGEKIQKEVPQVHNFMGQWKLEELLPALYRGKYLISNDNGAMHMAVSVDLPTVSIFGPTALAHGFRPWSSSAVVVQKKLHCRPCFNLKVTRSVCPMGTHECLKGLSVSSVLSILSQRA